MTRAVFLLFLCLSCALSGPQQDFVHPTDKKVFRNDYTYYPSTGYFYKFHKIPLKFQDAVNLCKFEGAELVVPKSEEEASLMVTLFNQPTSQVWVALHDIYAEGDFVTLDGSSIETVYNKWSFGEPNNSDQNEDCVVLNNNKEYNDVGCSRPYNFICARLESTVDYNWNCETHDKEYVYSSEGTRCYKLHRDVRSWHDAYKICTAEQAILAIVNSREEANLLTDMINKKYPMSSLAGSFEKRYFHVGFSDLITPGAFHTIDDKPLCEAGFEEWENHQPDNYNGDEHCGSLTRNGKLNDLNCDVKALFFCEKDVNPFLSVSLLGRTSLALNNST